MRLIVARCEVSYTGRLSTRLPEAVRLLVIKADGTFMVFDDGGSQVKPLNCSPKPRTGSSRMVERSNRRNRENVRQFMRQFRTRSACS